MYEAARDAAPPAMPTHEDHPPPTTPPTARTRSRVELSEQLLEKSAERRAALQACDAALQACDAAAEQAAAAKAANAELEQQLLQAQKDSQELVSLRAAICDLLGATPETERQKLPRVEERVERQH